VHVVVSTRSGLRLAQDFDQHVLRPLLGAVGLRQSESGDGGYQVTVTRDSNTIRDFARELGKDEHAEEKTILLVSGDGGIVDLLNGLDHSSPPSSPSPPPPPTIALLPLGTANALFHSLHKPHYARPAPTPSPLTLALRTLLKGTAAPLPTFKASFSPGARLISAPVDPAEEQQQKQQQQHPDTTTTTAESTTETTTTPTTPIPHLIGAIVASYGFHASLVWESDTPAYRAHGDARFKMAAAELLRVGHAYEVGVEVRRDASPAAGFVSVGGGGGGEGGKFNYVLATLVSNLEKTFAISPAGRPLDGVLRLVHFGDVGGARTMEIMMAAYREGAHVGMPDVGYEEVEEVRVTIREEDARWRKVCVDGSVVEVEQGGWMSVQTEKRERLQVLVDGCVAK
jgi:diacylglycerol kinase family enzyme